MNMSIIFGFIFAFFSFCKGKEPKCSGKRCEELLVKIEKLECRLEYSRELLEGNMKEKKKENPVQAPACQQCPDTWIQFNGSCYIFVAAKHPFDGAKAYCIGLGANLVHIENEVENSFLKNELRKLKEDHYWTGLTDTDTEGMYKWVDDNTTASFTDWIPGQPNNSGGKEHCMHFHSNHDYTWNDAPCSSSYSSICERKANQ